MLDGIPERVRENGGIPLREAFLVSYGAKASDERDRVYALRGLLNYNDRQALVVDYAEPLSSAFLNMLTHLFRNGEGPFLLSFLRPDRQWESDSVEKYDLPSWAAKVFAPWLEDSGFLDPRTVFSNISSVSGSASNFFDGNILSDGRTLGISTLYLGKVVDIRQVQSKNVGVEQFINQLREACRISRLAKSMSHVKEEYRSTLAACGSKESILETSTCINHWDRWERERLEPLFTALTSDHAGAATKSLNPYRELEVDFYLKKLGADVDGLFLFATDTGLLGVASQPLSQGDEIAILLGTVAPFIVRPCPEYGESHCKLINPCYISGIM
jgi:hypothetical protein